MGIRPFTDQTGDETQLVEQNIGEAYLVVKHVREHIEYVKHVSTHLAEVYRVAQSIEAVDSIVAEITKLDTVLANLADITSVADSITQVQAIGTNIVALLDIHSSLPELLDIQANLATFLAELDTLTALDGRVTTIETALPGKQDQSANLDKIAALAQAEIANIMPDPTTEYGADGLGGAADFAAFEAVIVATEAALPMPILLNSSDAVDLATYIRKDTQPFWPYLRAFMQSSLSNGKRIKLRRGHAWHNDGEVPETIIAPANFMLDVAEGAEVDFSGIPQGSTYRPFIRASGGYGPVSRTLAGDIAAGQDYIDLAPGEGAKFSRNQRILLRATEGLRSLSVGAFTLLESMASVSPVMDFWAPTTVYAANAGVFGEDGFSYYCSTPHTSGLVFDSTKWTKFGFNAKSEEHKIERVEGDRLWLKWSTKRTYVNAAKAIVQGHTNTGHIRISNFGVQGAAPIPKWLGEWGSGIDFAIGDGVVGNNDSYICVVPHTSGTFATDLANGYWVSTGSDRLFEINIADRVTIEGGTVKDFSGDYIRLISAAEYVIRDHEGHPANYEGTPGGYLYVGGSSVKGLIDNTSVWGGSQPIMISGSGGHYGVTDGLVINDPRVYGSYNAISTHWMSDGLVINNPQLHDIASAAIDTRTKDTVINRGRLTDIGGAGVLLRFAANGLVIDGLTIDGALSGIQLDDSTTLAYDYEPGNLTFCNLRLLNIGGSGSHGGIDLEYKRGTLNYDNEVAPFTAGNTIQGGTSGATAIITGSGVTDNGSTGSLKFRSMTGGPFQDNESITEVGAPTGEALVNSTTGGQPTLGKVRMSNVYIETNDGTVIINVGGKWNEPEFENVHVRGAGRSYWLHDAGFGVNNGPISPSFVGCTFGGGASEPLIANVTGVRGGEKSHGITQAGGVIPSVASSATLTFPSYGNAIKLTGTIAVTSGNQAAIREGEIWTIHLTDNTTISHAAPTANRFKLAGNTDFVGKAGDILVVQSDGVNWVELSRTVRAAPVLRGSKAHDWPSIGATFGGNFQSTTVTVTGAALGDEASAWMDSVNSGIMFWAKVTAANTVTVWALNFTAAPIDPASGTLYAKVVKA